MKLAKKTLQKLLMKKETYTYNHKLKENIRMMKSQRSDIERNKMIEGGKIINIDKIIRQNERINNNLKSQV